MQLPDIYIYTQQQFKHELLQFHILNKDVIINKSEDISNI